MFRSGYDTTILRMEWADRDDVTSIMVSLMFLHEKVDCCSRSSGTTVKKKKKLTADFWRRDAEARRQLAERIAYHERLKEERSGRERPAAG